MRCKRHPVLHLKDGEDQRSELASTKRPISTYVDDANVHICKVTVLEGDGWPAGRIQVRNMIRNTVQQGWEWRVVFDVAVRGSKVNQV